jgi:ABC-2 type transport system permease protein
MMAIYGGSSMSFAGVTLPVNTASWFTRLWSDLLPYTAYAKLQTQQWIIGSPWHISLKQVSILLLFVLVLLLLSCRSVTKSLREPAS